ncbi:hypothetical protein BHM03_00009037 [Ensete ventricosum]|nr:hypothetical protein BHM03_00009037 [Ensete ventricosum]
MRKSVAARRQAASRACHINAKEWSGKEWSGPALAAQLGGCLAPRNSVVAWRRASAVSRPVSCCLAACIVYLAVIQRDGDSLKASSQASIPWSSNGPFIDGRRTGIEAAEKRNALSIPLSDRSTLRWVEPWILEGSVVRLQEGCNIVA